MKITKLLLLASVATLLIFSSCKKASDVVGETTAIDYQLQVANATTMLNQRIDAGNLQWTSGFASPTLIKLEAKQGAKELEFKSKSVARVNLFAPLAGSLGNLSLASGTYDEVEFKLQLNQNGSDASLELHGLFAASNGNIPVVLTVNEPLEIKAEKQNVTITATSINAALTTIDLANLSLGITQTMLNSAQLTNGSIIISSSSNATLYSTIISNLNKFHSCELGHH